MAVAMATLVRMPMAVPGSIRIGVTRAAHRRSKASNRWPEKQEKRAAN
jgi:hypothetical protein